VKGAVKGGEALLSKTVDVIGELVPGLLHRAEERPEERIGDGTAFEEERTVGAPVLIAPARQFSIRLK